MSIVPTHYPLPPITDSTSVVYVKCDVTQWQDQVSVFETARKLSPNGGIDIVIANAGIYGPDTLDGWSFFRIAHLPFLFPSTSYIH